MVILILLVIQVEKASAAADSEDAIDYKDIFHPLIDEDDGIVPWESSKRNCKFWSEKNDFCVNLFPSFC